MFLHFLDQLWASAIGAACIVSLARNAKTQPDDFRGVGLCRYKQCVICSARKTLLRAECWRSLMRLLTRQVLLWSRRLSKQPLLLGGGIGCLEDVKTFAATTRLVQAEVVCSVDHATDASDRDSGT